MPEELDQGAPCGGPEGEREQAILMQSGNITPAAGGESRVTRGMPAISADGREVGWVAAVVMDGRGGDSRGLLLARPRTTLEYYLVPSGSIRSVNDGQVLLGIRAEAAWSLPRRDTGTRAEPDANWK